MSTCASRKAPPSDFWLVGWLVARAVSQRESPNGDSERTADDDGVFRRRDSERIVSVLSCTQRRASDNGWVEGGLQMWKSIVQCRWRSVWVNYWVRERRHGQEREELHVWEQNYFLRAIPKILVKCCVLCRFTRCVNKLCYLLNQKGLSDTIWYYIILTAVKKKMSSTCRAPQV